MQLFLLFLSALFFAGGLALLVRNKGAAAYLRSYNAKAFEKTYGPVLMGKFQTFLVVITRIIIIVWGVVFLLAAYTFFYAAVFQNGVMQ